VSYIGSDVTLILQRNKFDVLFFVRQMLLVTEPRRLHCKCPVSPLGTDPSLLLILTSHFCIIYFHVIIPFSFIFSNDNFHENFVQVSWFHGTSYMSSQSYIFSTWIL